jgi:hypothetical protein
LKISCIRWDASNLMMLVWTHSSALIQHPPTHAVHHRIHEDEGHDESQSQKPSPLFSSPSPESTHLVVILWTGWTHTFSSARNNALHYEWCSGVVEGVNMMVAVVLNTGL